MNNVNICISINACDNKHQYALRYNNALIKWKSAQRRRKHFALAVVRRTHKQTQTKKQTHTQTDRDDYNTLRSLARSVITVYQMTGFIKEFEVVVAPP